MLRMQRELSSFPLPSQQRLRLHNAGFIIAADVLELKPTELSKELNIPKEDAFETLQLVRVETEKAKNVPGASCSNPSVIDRSFTDGSQPASTSHLSALDMLRDEKLQQCIITFSEKLDEMLGGGIPLGKITEICGAPGIGKTQFSIQLSVDVQIPQCFGGVEGEAIYIDTEGSFIVDRVADVADATLKHCRYITDMTNSEEQVDRMKTFDLESILAGIHYFRCHDYVELLALVHTLPDFLDKHPKVSLITLDSIAFPFRHDFEDFSLRTRLLNGLAQSFIKMASQYRLAVLLTNQMTTKILSDRGQASHLIPALGESWGHASTIRLILYWQHSQRRALLYKSPTHPEATVPYQITTGGIRDVHNPGPSGDQVDPQTIHTESDTLRKRPRTDT